jgi:multiple sugar transport system ATP-binding protein
MATVALDGVSKRYADDGGSVVAVDELTLTIEDGDFVVLVGPSGCGKTTTLRCIAGLETVTEGDIELSGEKATDEPPENRDVAMVFQSYALYPHMTVRENMSFGLKYATDLGEREIDEKVWDTVEMMGIEDLLDRRPEDLSGGQQQRVSLGRAIVRDPSEFLMDEPLSTLDAKLRAEMRTYLQQFQEELGVTTVYVTHDQTEAMTMGDKIAILKDGRLQQYGTPAECYHRPINTFVAEFLGEPSMNLVEMKLRDGTLVSDVFECELDAPPSTLGSHDDVVVGVRPEALQIADAEPAGPTEFTGVVSVVEHLGRESNVHVAVDGTDIKLTAIVSGRPSVSADETVTVRVPKESMHVFDGRSGDAIRNATSDGELKTVDDSEHAHSTG